MIKSRRMRWAGHAEHMGETNVYKVLVGQPVEKEPFKRLTHRQKDNIKMDLREIGWDGVILRWILGGHGGRVWI
jgi:hypothetical protein